MNYSTEIGIRQLFDHDTWTYTYMVFDLETLEGVIIDPVKEKLAEAVKNGLPETSKMFEKLVSPWLVLGLGGLGSELELRLGLGWGWS